MSSIPPLAHIEMHGIVKRFPGVLASDQVDFTLRHGETHTLLGENGAGKSTLMKILYGMLQPDAGTIQVAGRSVRIGSPAQALQLGIGMVHQHFMLVPSLTVAENVALGMRSARRPLLDLAATTRKIRDLSERYHLKIDPNAAVWQLSVGEQQRVEIIKALIRDASVLILDEPTAVLTPQEVADLFDVLRQMTADGHALVFISHKLQEVLALSDRITVMRDGRVVGTMAASEATQSGLIRLMVGRAIGLQVERETLIPGEVRLRLDRLCARDDQRTPALRDVSLEVHAREIVGIAGVSGNGQRELAEVIAGLRRATSGSVQMDDLTLGGMDAASRVAAGLSYIPEERMRDGAIRSFDIAENSILHDHMREPISRFGILKSAGNPH